MTLQQMSDAFKAGTLKLNENSHRINPFDNWFADRLEHLNQLLDDYKKEGKNPDTWLYMINYDYAPGSYIWDSRDIYCFQCGERFALVFMNDTTLELIDWNSYHNYLKEFEANGGKHKEFYLSPAQIKSCMMKELAEKEKLVAEIQVPTGQLIFKNYFDKKELSEWPEDEKQYDAEHEINAIRGRYNLMKYLATLNVGYGQMGNMSASILKNKIGTEIIVCDTYKYDDESDHEFSKNYDEFPEYTDYTYCGTISLSVWRWMCTDKKILIDAKEPYPYKRYSKETIEWKKLKQTLPKKHSYEDVIQVNVEPGTWIIEHYYDFAKSKTTIYSKLFLKKS